MPQKFPETSYPIPPITLYVIAEEKADVEFLLLYERVKGGVILPPPMQIRQKEKSKAFSPPAGKVNANPLYPYSL